MPDDVAPPAPGDGDGDDGGAIGDGSVLRALVEELGMEESVVARAAADGTLGLLVVEHLAIPEPPTFTQADIDRESGLGDDARRFWRALGFPDPDPDEMAFSAVDLEMLRLVDAIIRSEVVLRENALQIARVIGISMQRVAQTQIDAIDARLASEASTGADTAAAVQRAESMVPMMPQVLEYAWRRHLQSAARRRLASEAPLVEGPPARAVGFADMVGFTSLAQELDDHDLAVVLERFETTAHELVTGHGGRVVKMIGDEVMFEVPRIEEAALLALELADAFHQDDVVNDIRVGFAHGPVLAREGDLYGPTVNLASRLVGIAYAGSVVTTAEVGDELADDERFAFKSVRGRNLKHIGRVSLVALRWADDVSEGIAERARRHRGVVAERIAERVRRTADPADDPTSDGAGEEE